MLHLIADTINDGLSPLATQGILGILLSISLPINFLLVKMLFREKDKRIIEAKNVTDNIALPLKLLQQSVDLQTAKIQEAKSR